MKSRVREIVFWSPLILLVGLAVVGVVKCRCDRPGGGGAGQHGIPAGWYEPPTETTPFLPFKKNKASEYTAEFPPGSSVVVVTTQKGEQIEIGILPDGTVVVPDGVTAVVYEKRGRLINGEFRPFVFGGLGLGGGYAGGGVDLVRVWRLHGGVGAAATYWPDGNDETRDVDVGVIAKASVNVWRNLDLIGGGGYGTKGKMAFGGVELAIQ